MRLYHATSTDNIEAIIKDGLRSGAYLTNSAEQAEYYADTISDEGKVPIIIELDLSELISAVGEDNIEPDHPSIAEPITSTLELDEDEVYEAWEEAEGTWRDSLEIVNSVKVKAAIPSNIISFDNYEKTMKFS